MTPEDNDTPHHQDPVPTDPGANPVVEATEQSETTAPGEADADGSTREAEQGPDDASFQPNDAPYSNPALSTPEEVEEGVNFQHPEVVEEMEEEADGEDDDGVQND